MRVTGDPSDSGSEPGSAPGAGSASGWRRLLGALQRLILPACCLSCARPLDAGAHPLGLCLACRGRLRGPAPGCAVCGTPIPAARMRELAGGFACGRCRTQPPAFERLVVAWSYAGPLEAVIGGLKYRRLDYLGAHLARGLAARLTTSGAETPAVPGEAREDGSGNGPAEWDLVVPVPLHWWRRRVRGYNQAERIARPLAAEIGAPFRDLLRRSRSTRPQARLSRAERLRNPAGAFALRRGWRATRWVTGRRVLLVDDVVTTGATLSAAATVLKDAGAASVTAAAAARTPEGRPP